MSGPFQVGATPIAAELVEELLRTGYAVVRIGRGAQETLAAALERGVEFFRQPEVRKLRHAVTGAGANHGYRPMGIEYSVVPERPDCNESFTLWSDRVDLIPNSSELPLLIRALQAWQSWCAALAQQLIGAFAGHYRGEPVAFATASHLQINSYMATGADRSLLQERHEDGHLFTMLHATAPGLEVFVGERPQPFTMAVNEVLVMPGSILSAMTDEAIAPLYHQVRNLQQPNRRSVMYFVNPQLDIPLLPWVAAERRGDLRATVRSNPLAFGLPAVEEL